MIPENVAHDTNHLADDTRPVDVYSAARLVRAKPGLREKPRRESDVSERGIEVAEVPERVRAALEGLPLE